MPAHPLSAYEIKSAELSLVALCLRTASLHELETGLQAQLAETPGFFDQDPVLVDLGELPQDETAAVPDFLALAQLLASHRLRLLAFRGAQPDWRQKALAAGLVEGDDARLRHLAQLASSAGETKAKSGVNSGVQNPAPAANPVAAVSLADTAALVIDKPLRSGQQVYAKGRDLVLLAMVNPGAEVIADGHIHVYAALRGKAIAGARGWASARIFAQAMEPELLSIAGIYRTSENPLPAEIQGQAAMVQLHRGPDGERLLIEPLKS